jgi:hypothetical protein
LIPFASLRPTHSQPKKADTQHAHPCPTGHANPLIYRIRSMWFTPMPDRKNTTA